MRTRRISMPSSAKAGEVIEIRTVVMHPMVTGHTSDGANTVPRRIIHTFLAEYDGAEIFRAEMFPGIAANPFLAFTTVATRSGDVTFTWIDDTGERTTERRHLTVEPV